jgi:hypothetical protein
MDTPGNRPKLASRLYRGLVHHGEPKSSTDTTDRTASLRHRRRQQLVKYTAGLENGGPDHHPAIHDPDKLSRGAPGDYCSAPAGIVLGRPPRGLRWM